MPINSEICMHVVQSYQYANGSIFRHNCDTDQVQIQSSLKLQKNGIYRYLKVVETIFFFHIKLF